MARQQLGGGYEVDIETEMVFQNGVVLSSSEYEPIYTLTGISGLYLCGIWNKKTNSIILASGNTVTNYTEDRIRL